MIGGRTFNNCCAEPRRASGGHRRPTRSLALIIGPDQTAETRKDAEKKPCRWVFVTFGIPVHPWLTNPRFDLRFLFQNRADDLYVSFLGNHDEVRAVLKTRKFD